MTVSERLVDATAGWLSRRFDRRGFLLRAAVVGSALAAEPVEFVLRPGTAYASVCGSGSACSDGWTVLCCSINNGVNQCPPGSFAGGWWKADNASLCGGKARYYIDCQAECTHCTSGCGSFCSSSCWNCSCHCNDSTTTCDNRRVCCNVFRYGQCNQQRACSGPVMCRQISCRPPYEWLPCTTSSATDDNTTTHTAPCLPGWDAITEHFYALGGEKLLGPSVNAHYSVPNGLAQRYLGGRIYWSSSLGAHEVHGAVLACYLSLGGSTSVLQLPTTDERACADGVGRYNRFQQGAVYWTPSTGAHEVHTAIYQKWAALGWERSAVGYPTTNQMASPDGVGQYNHFQNGAIYWTSALGAHEVHGLLYQKWAALGWERGVLGYPVADTAATPDGAGRYSTFEHGAVYWSSATGAHEVHGSIYPKWTALDATAGVLGYPTSDQLVTADGLAQYNTFQHGAVYAATATGTHEVHGPIYDKWMSLGGEPGSLGLPTSDQYTSGTLQRSDFVHGSITYDPSTGQLTVTYA